MKEKELNTIMMSPVRSNSQRAMVSTRNFYYFCIACGALCLGLFFGAFIAAGFFPPLKPWWSAERTAQHYHDHRTGIRIGACFLVLSGMFYLPYSALISAQMKRIPSVPLIFSQIQIAAAAGSIFTFMVPAMILAIACYRPDRSDEMVELLNDAFWICVLMGWPCFMAQNWAFSYAILSDRRERPLIPRYIAFVNFTAPVLFSPAIALHFVHSGVVAWDGGLTFWTAGMAFGVQFMIDFVCLFYAIRKDDGETGEFE